MIVLDTNVVSELMRERPARAVIAWMDSNPQDSFLVTAVTIAEILYGIRRLAGGRRRARLEAAFDMLMSRGFADRILPLDAVAANHYSRIVVDRQRSGRPINAFDALIAATALAHNAELATRDIADFEDCGIRLIDPWA